MRWREEDLSRKDVQGEPNSLRIFASYDQDLETAMRGAKAALIKRIDF